ncbi:Mth938-like domain-containing protein [Rhodospirillum rubrum]|uniref:Mth938-like domain-containing protein n=1 Tax=Rhodospirillum rubrum (strain ATCC 11170 / ATH 1.1.1 / DSM 467 / LMG 4362 / NCIMB 8255 / S1) TaxID=269796 RepID=Q2RTI3_RHORT|nr:Mth938-like domain-containing protein [Rhodospirillum rubrum]ABC22562.1 Protein of unknown function DUF598 [Rhodospirillum rubrum ATCC 11170]AEO48280.1 hypothetical protein F11_09070 [Rhodospirillum rubrum F11]MBK5954151.1 hypothetical protein [Rhodospirillum rubrum]QXG82189.1 Mth938-like domain-containing protein [Rhodospirillum rubrum]HAP98799.1 hypothetical protein [Rhodospirillum rubrum]
MELKMEIPASRRVVEAYGDGGFRVSGERHLGSLLVTPERVFPWVATRIDEMDLASLAPLLAMAEDLDIVLIGCGPRMTLLPRPLREALSAAGIAPETMDTGAACRTYNVLIQEDRRVAAALIAL